LIESYCLVGSLRVNPRPWDDVVTQLLVPYNHPRTPDAVHWIIFLGHHYSVYAYYDTPRIVEIERSIFILILVRF